MALPPSTADILVKISAGIYVLIVGVQVVENFGCSMNAFLRLAKRGSLGVRGRPLLSRWGA